MNYEIAYLGLGTNSGERKKNLDNAIDLLNNLRGVTVEKESEVYETSPMYFYDQDDFLNQVLQIRTTYSPIALLNEIKRIETSVGRKLTTFRNGPRILDIDILSYEKTTVFSESLTVPHVGISSRKFVLAPWADIAPDFIPPGYFISVKKMWQKIHDNSVVNPYFQAEEVHI